MINKACIPFLILLWFLPSIIQAEEILPLQGKVFTQYHLLKLSAALVLVLLIFVGFTWIMRRFNRVQSNQHGVRIVAGLNVGAKEKVVVVEVEGQKLLLGVTSNSINKLLVLQPMADDSVPGNKIFGETFRKVQSGKSLI